jgi:nemo like kinase
MNGDEQCSIKLMRSVFRAARDPRTGRRIALKKLPNVFQSLISCRRVYRELKMLCSFDHDNVS